MTDRTDLIDRIRAAWAAAMPGMDTSAIDVWGRLHRTSTLATSQIERLLADSGVTRSEFDVLCALARMDRPLRASEVTAETMLSGAATTKLTTRLETAGLLRRERSDRDGRAVQLSLTDAGRALVVREMPRALAHDERLLDGFSDDDRAALSGLLARLLENAQREV
ncbi:MarR family transcriptional regulator [Microbacterium sp. EYE_5]|uniref:MarR family winged helix-turn-helix transcriptional regulator n=1 Tax=unclassified Microbacterium TaxID=2609290 RepID=UPI0020050DB0|nr:MULTISPECIES: MarR family transcriptional regulator [unclassified Microbacterium]MCK6080128.1 MarR family transcriptional regulator [Microbacterium sp. EYE_382]MCK6085399.1 MarR family transcriptional regulator [Microbacterium sp. EYE_384]MCK6122376.1 MarR family transcriptional regulator [Microbacterium sp. EYE_80]MCK6126162.1 MarR family transcriptional regulator [Microbacterium sp. EYE_79]MCK6141083.1 MarR family transcriptional regulator [Microbacterium sp. EYE_39]